METWDENRIEFGEHAGTKLEGEAGGEAASVSGRCEEVKSGRVDSSCQTELGRPQQRLFLLRLNQRAAG